MKTLDWITIEGFRSIRSIERLDLLPINILIGANGSGKSNFLEAFSFLRSILHGELRNYIKRAGGAERILHFGSRSTPKLSIQISFDQEINQYKIDLEPDKIGSLFPVEEATYFWNKGKYNRPYDNPILGDRKEAGISNPEIRDRREINQYVSKYLDTWRIFQFHDTSSVSPMRRESNVNDNRFLRADGSNLASFLYLLRHKHKKSYKLIRKTVRLVAPFFDDFVLHPSALNKGTIRLEWQHRGSHDEYFDVSSLSDGSLRFIALTTLLLQPRKLKPHIILMDEPELGLHPYAITILASLVRQAATESQVILATQSPLILDSFDPQDVIVANRVQGSTVLERLEAEKLRDWLEDYSLGQLWEKNEFGGQPAAEFLDGESSQ